MVSIPIKRASIDYDYTELDGFKVCVEVGSGYTHSANTIKNLIDSGAELEFVIRRPAEDKTKKQLGTAWAAMREMANALGLTPDEIYHQMIREYGKSTMMKVPIEEAGRTIELHSEHGGNFGEVIGRARDDENCAVIKLWWGMSSYNKKEMSDFLDGLSREYEELFS